MKATLKAQSKAASFDKNCCKHALGDQKLLATANLAYGNPEENTVTSFAMSGDHSDLNARITAAFPDISLEGFLMVLIIKCSNPEEAKKGLVNFNDAVQAILAEVPDSERTQELLNAIQMLPGPQDMVIVGDELFICKNLSQLNGVDFLDEQFQMAAAILQSLDFKAYSQFINDGDFTKWRTANINEINCQWKAHADLFMNPDWKERMIAINTQAMGPNAEGEAAIRIFNNFNFGMRINASNSEKSVEGQKKMLNMFSDVSGLKYSPVGTTLDAFTEGTLDMQNWNWAAKKVELAPMVRDMLNGTVGEGFSIDTFPFVADFVNCWNTNVVCDYEVHMLLNTASFKFGFKTAGFGDFVQDIMGLLK